MTGAAGFIGSHVVERLAAAGHRVRGLVRTPTQEVAVRSLGAEPVHGDLTRPASLRAAADGTDTVIHAAARVTDWGEWPAFEAATVRGTVNTLRAAVAAGVRRFVLVSSVAVYDNRVGDRLHVVPEDTPQNGVGDRLLGHYLAVRCWPKKRPGGITAAANWKSRRSGRRGCMGPATNGPSAAGRVHEPAVLMLVRPKDPVIDPIYVTDVADCIILAATRPQAVGRAYNAAPREEIRLRHSSDGSARRWAFACRGGRSTTG